MGRVIKALSRDSTQFKRYLIKTQLGEKEYPAVQLAPLNFVDQEGYKRGLWPLGRVIKALSRDSTQFKRYLIKTQLGEKEYPAVQLAPLNFVDQDGTER